MTTSSPPPRQCGKPCPRVARGAVAPRCPRPPRLEFSDLEQCDVSRPWENGCYVRERNRSRAVSKFDERVRALAPAVDGFAAVETCYPDADLTPQRCTKQGTSTLSRRPDDQPALPLDPNADAHQALPRYGDTTEDKANFMDIRTGKSGTALRRPSATTTYSSSPTVSALRRQRHHACVRASASGRTHARTAGALVGLTHARGRLPRIRETGRACRASLLTGLPPGRRTSAGPSARWKSRTRPVLFAGGRRGDHRESVMVQRALKLITSCQSRWSTTASSPSAPSTSTARSSEGPSANNRPPRTRTGYSGCIASG